ncbi:hypothetical protein CGRA01v4_09207 [Colletotrichum graminicola]|nr:hypothetical protein CGRA01v4_09207 [Colletotrichum graminicola]
MRSRAFPSTDIQRKHRITVSASRYLLAV